MVSAEQSDLYDLAPNGVLAIDRAGNLVYVNARLLNMFGYERAELIGSPVEIIIPARFDAAHRDLRAGYFDDGQHTRLMGSGHEFFGRKRDGSEFPVDVALGVVDRGPARFVFAAVEDLTDRRSMNTRLREVSRAYTTLDVMARTLRQAGDPTGIFDFACRLAVSEGGYLGAWVARHDGNDAIKIVSAAGEPTDYITGLSLRLRTGMSQLEAPIAAALTRGIGTYIEDFDAHADGPEWIGLARRHGVRASATIPLLCEDDIVAALTFYTAIPDVFDTHMRSLIDNIGTTVRSALEFVRSETRLSRLEAHRRALLERLVEVQERERARIAADVHDDSVQALSAVTLRLGLLQRRVHSAAPQLDDDLAVLQSTVSAATERLRNLLFDLEPADTDAGILGALESAAAYIFAATDIRWQVSGIVTATPTGPGYIQSVRIAKEAMVNVRSHSGATAVRIAARNVADGLEITISDDGAGIDAGAESAGPGHRGLLTMRDRAEVVGGSFDIESASGDRVTVRFWIPLA